MHGFDIDATVDPPTPGRTDLPRARALLSDLQQRLNYQGGESRYCWAESNTNAAAAVETADADNGQIRQCSHYQR